MCFILNVQAIMEVLMANCQSAGPLNGYGTRIDGEFLTDTTSINTLS